jgi:hypothetical protein
VITCLNNGGTALLDLITWLAGGAWMYWIVKSAVRAAMDERQPATRTEPKEWRGP